MESYIEEFNKLLERMENETGNIFELKITEFEEKSIILGDLKKRNMPLEVHSMCQDYGVLNGFYGSKAQLREKINALMLNDMFEEHKTIQYNGRDIIVGKCKECHSYGDGNENNDPRKMNLDILRKCRICRKKFSTSKWNGISVSDHSGNIYCCDGRMGAFAQRVKTIGKYKFIKK